MAVVKSQAFITHYRRVVICFHLFFFLSLSPSFLNSTVFKNLKYLQVPKRCISCVLLICKQMHTYSTLPGKFDHNRYGFYIEDTHTNANFVNIKYHTYHTHFENAPRLFSPLIPLETGSNERTSQDPVHNTRLDVFYIISYQFLFTLKKSLFSRFWSCNTHLPRMSSLVLIIVLLHHQQNSTFNI